MEELFKAHKAVLADDVGAISVLVAANPNFLTTTPMIDGYYGYWADVGDGLLITGGSAAYEGVEGIFNTYNVQRTTRTTVDEDGTITETPMTYNSCGLSRPPLTNWPALASRSLQQVAAKRKAMRVVALLKKMTTGGGGGVGGATHNSEMYDAASEGNRDVLSDLIEWYPEAVNSGCAEVRTPVSPVIILHHRQLLCIDSLHCMVIPCTAPCLCPCCSLLLFVCRFFVHY
jgi:hypothetical protein